ncbi:Peroxisome biosynthesis protein pex1 [Cryomyces antarcticus]|uniref:Peroxisome biosynthesis protein pex1 n=1 Tax=Cryomyces antarcticus TaxID=329879 RepID=A0ABR0M8A5_9PEZI|nr:Peroxisome biosynthesis protein pex1 [Cryomyces antarcticus]KAK5020329.1 Peroxisome biosynthesis protein pex1 [Cryomyces antarcticus]KAK5294443.1 Peroxisome biosynthesis protein pex1 [Cryomyces antarcticus]
MYFPILSVAPQYFDQHRGSAMGFVLSGAGVGGLVLSPIIRLLIAKISIRWTLRFLCFLNLVLSAPIALTIAPSRFISRCPTHIDMSTARRPTFLLSTVAAFLQAGGNLVPLSFLPEYSTVLGHSPGFGALLLATNNGINSTSGIVAGAAGDRLGRQNTLIFTVVCSVITVCSFWLASVANESKPLWLVFVVFYGIFAGGYNALFPTTIAEVFAMQAYASVNGFIHFIRGHGISVW